MNRVGHEGRGESVWLGWFLHTVLAAFAPIAEARGERPRAERWRAHMKALRRALERHGWDGDWYRRAFFDDGTPLGSALNAECRIDSIAQSWSVLSGAANPPHAERAMAAVEEYLVRRGDGLVLLFTPPFDHSDVDPGYVKGYLPGIRENGGQYTHGAIWSVLAFAALGDGDKAGELFSILNPINHASTRAGVHRYKVEPYVMAADVYTEPPHVGRGGWTWYTGSAGWMYQAGVEWILGFRLRGTTLLIDPCIPRAWPGYEIDFRYHSASVRDRRGEPAGGQSRRGVGGARRTAADGRRRRDPARRRRRHAPGPGRPRRRPVDGRTRSLDADWAESPVAVRPCCVDPWAGPVDRDHDDRADHGDDEARDVQAGHVSDVEDRPDQEPPDDGADDTQDDGGDDAFLPPISRFVMNPSDRAQHDPCDDSHGFLTSTNQGRVDDRRRRASRVRLRRDGTRPRMGFPGGTCRNARTPRAARRGPSTPAHAGTCRGRTRLGGGRQRTVSCPSRCRTRPLPPSGPAPWRGARPRC